MSQYGKAEYWEERYSRDPDAFDWYQRYFAIRDILTASVLPEHRILNVGAGNSRLSEEMFDEGYQNITNIDISQTAVKAMTEKYKDKGPNFKYQQMDVRAMDFADGSFDAIIDKGTLDSILCGEGSSTNALKMISEIYRVLAPGGVYFLVSFGKQEYRMSYLKKTEKAEYDWDVKVTPMDKPTIKANVTPATDEKQIPNTHFIYVCTKGGKKAEEQAEPAAQPPTEVKPNPPA